MLIATFRTFDMQRDHGEGTAAETGHFEFALHVDRKLIDKDSAPRAFIMHLIAQTAANLCKQHQLPLFLWTAEIDPRVCSLTNLPALVDFK